MEFVHDLHCLTIFFCALHVRCKINEGADLRFCNLIHCATRAHDTICYILGTPLESHIRACASIVSVVAVNGSIIAVGLPYA